MRLIVDHCLKRLVWGFHVLQTLLSSSLSLLVRYCWGVCWFQNTWSNSPQQWGRFSPVFWTGPYRLLSKVCQESRGSWVVQHFDSFCIVDMPHNLIPYLLCQHLCLARRVIVWPMTLFFQFPDGLGVGFCTFPIGVLRALWFVDPWEDAHLGMWVLSYGDSMVWDRVRVWGNVPPILIS